MSDQILKLTGIIQPGLTKGIFVGRIKEIQGAVSQGHTEEEAYTNLVSMVPALLNRKKEEAKRLLNAQNAPKPTEDLNPNKYEVSIERIEEMHEA